MQHPEVLVALLAVAAALVVMRAVTFWQDRRLLRRILEQVAHPERFPPPKPLEPECHYIVHLSEHGVRCERPDGRTEQVAWDDLQRVEVLTTDDGPFAPDVFWALLGTSGGCLIPQGATGERALSERLGQLPGFDHGAVIQAMGSTANARFLCWQRTP